jgi:membrane-associated protease RseP (regulator of RpoE activity)
MKLRICLITLALAASSALAADPPASRENQDSGNQPAASAAAAAVAARSAQTVAVAADKAAATAAASAEMAELRTQIQELSQRMATLSMEMGDAGPRAYAFRYIGDPDRAIIGVVLGKNDKEVLINAVTPGGPAARAGLRNGDVIVAINGKTVPAGDGEAAREQARDLLSDLKQDDKLTIAYRRGNQRAEVELIAERHKAWTWPSLIGDGDDDDEAIARDIEQRVEREMQRAEHEGERVRVEIERAREHATRADREAIRASAHRAMRDTYRGMPWWGLNLAPVNAELGRYFGADKGALVISADDGSLPGLRGGDVIVEVAGEAISRPEDALRALRDQPAGKEVPIRVLRERKSIALALKAPEFKSIFAMPPLPPLPPTPPVAPVPPVPDDVPGAAPTPPAPPAPESLPDAPPVPAAPPAPPVPNADVL